jgi:hypothetical protein
MDISRLRQQIVRLAARRRTLEQENLKPGEMIEGSLVEHYKPCGRAACRCKTEGRLHGPYWYISTQKGGKTSLIYVKKIDLVRARRLTQNYRRFQSNMAKLRRIQRQINDVFGKIRAYYIEEGKRG